MNTRRLTQTPVGVIQPVFSNLSISHARLEARYSRHQHADYQVVIVEQGRYDCRVNDTPLELTPGQVLVVKPGDWHEDECRPPLKYSTLNFRLTSTLAEVHSISLFVDGVRPEQQVARASRGQFTVLMRDIERESNQEDPLSSMVLDALLRQFFWRMARHLPRAAISPAFLEHSGRQAFVARLHRLFQANLHTPMTVAHMADRLRMSERALTYQCRDALGDSPAHAFLRFKVEHAARTLAETNMSVKELSVSLGFANQYHFSRAYKRITGRAPSSDRRSG